MPKHLMLDLETLDTRPSTVVLSIGAIAFDPQTGWMDEYQGGGLELFPRVDEQLEAGRTISWDTMSWWLQQSEEARKAVAKPPRPRIGVENCLETFRDYCKRMGTTLVWSNGAAFDVVIMEHLMNYQRIPWRFYKVLDMRTMMWLKNVAKKGETVHTALQDAKDQAERVIESYRLLQGLHNDEV